MAFFRTSTRRRARLMARIEQAIFWICVIAAVGLVWTLARGLA
jgi:hypothetical protein